MPQPSARTVDENKKPDRERVGFFLETNHAKSETDLTALVQGQVPELPPWELPISREQEPESPPWELPVSRVQEPESPP